MPPVSCGRSDAGREDASLVECRRTFHHGLFDRRQRGTFSRGPAARLGPTLSGIAAACARLRNCAACYDRDSLHTSGPVAQLGARLNGIQEVTGSIPVRSTIHTSPKLCRPHTLERTRMALTFDSAARRGASARPKPRRVPSEVVASGRSTIDRDSLCERAHLHG